MKYELLDILADGRFHSGEALGRRLGVSRAAIWKQVKALKALSVDCHSVPGKGYRLAKKIELLDPAQIAAEAGAAAETVLVALECHHELNSTNAYLMDRIGQLVPGQVCLAEMQHQGRGRRGKCWASPYGRNIYLSLYWRFHCSPALLSGLSLAVGVALVRALKSIGVDEVGLKWPNDLLWRKQKLAGILLEMSGEAAGPYHVVIGIGLNVNMGDAPIENIDQAWVDLSTVMGEGLSRNLVTGRILRHLAELLPIFERDGLEPFLDEWQLADAFAGQQVALLGGDGPVTGVAAGVDKNGALLLHTDSGIQQFHSGEVSLRAVEECHEGGIDAAD